MAKNLEEYLDLPYTFVLRRDDRDGIFVARVEELPGCSAHGGTEQEALSNLRDNMEVWISDCIESGDPVPEPVGAVELPSGKWLQRVPRSLHLKLIHLAKHEGVSLNQLVTSALAEVVGRRALKAVFQAPDIVGQRGLYSNLLGDSWAIVAGNYNILGKSYMTDIDLNAFEACIKQLMPPIARHHGVSSPERGLLAESEDQIRGYIES